MVCCFPDEKRTYPKLLTFKNNVSFNCKISDADVNATIVGIISTYPTKNINIWKSGIHNNLLCH